MALVTPVKTGVHPIRNIAEKVDSGFRWSDAKKRIKLLQEKNKIKQSKEEIMLSSARLPEESRSDLRRFVRKNTDTKHGSHCLQRTQRFAGAPVKARTAMNNDRYINNINGFLLKITDKPNEQHNHINI